MLNIIHIIAPQTAAEIPTQLMERPVNVVNVLIPSIILSFSLITIAKYRNSRVFVILSRLFVSSKNLDHILKEELRLNSISSIVLIANYLLVFGVSVFLKLFFIDHINFQLAIGYAIAVTLFSVVLQIVGLWVTGLITNESKTTSYPIIETVLLHQGFGIILFLLCLCWLLNPNYSTIFQQVFFGLIGIEFILRFFKSVVAVLRRGVAWYYIILYLCTLEILPIVAIIFLLKGNFIK